MGNMGTLTLSLMNAEGNLAVEPSCRVEFVRLDGMSILRADHLQFPPQHTFGLPAFPQGQNLHCVITPSLYRIRQSEFFTLTDGKQKSEKVLVLRDPSKWQARFTAWDALSAVFAPLKSVLLGKLLKLKHGPDVGMVGPTIYDGMSSPALQLAKMALLNLFVVTSTNLDPVSGKPWFSFVRQILVIDRERFVAIVDSDLYESVDHILNNLDQYKDQGFFPGDVSLHYDNIPSDYQITAPMISAKCAYEQGNIQFTLGKAKIENGDCVLLDCDMDENRAVIEHLSDIFKHAFTGGTNPIDIHEYIVYQQRGVDLGYDLVACA